ncbi:MAG: hypothetical protein FD130_1901, partial [Halothiobacillaceae bacterium]
TNRKTGATVRYQTQAAEVDVGLEDGDFTEKTLKRGLR